MKRKTFSEINITPLTDIFLVLLIMMMVVTPMIDFKGLNLSVLSSGEAEADATPKTLLVEVNALGEYTVGGRQIEKGQLLDSLKTEGPNNPDGVLIEVDPDASHESITLAMAAAEKAGVTKLAITEKEMKKK